MGINVRKGLIQLNGPHQARKMPKSFLNVALLSMHGSAYNSHFGNPTRREVLKRIIISKVLSKVDDNASSLPCF